MPKSASDQSNLVLSVAIKPAYVHQMILRYITQHFASLDLDERVGLIPYDQFVMLFKNKFLHAPNEDTITEALEMWLQGNTEFTRHALS